jgi:hypothetical protein
LGLAITITTITTINTIIIITITTLHDGGPIRGLTRRDGDYVSAINCKTLQYGKIKGERRARAGG